MASGVGAISSTMIPCDTAPATTAVSTGRRRRIAPSARRSIRGRSAVATGGGRRTNASGRSPTSVTSTIAAYAPAKGVGANRSVVRTNTSGPIRAATRPEVSTSEMATGCHSVETTSAAAKRK